MDSDNNNLGESNMSKEKSGQVEINIEYLYPIPNTYIVLNGAWHCSTVDLIYAGITYKAVAVFFRDQLRVQCLPFSVFFLICFDKCANKEVVYKMDIFIYMCVYTKSK